MPLTRGSIRHCVKAAFSAFKINKHEFLNILTHPKGKYYSLETDDDLNHREDSELSGETRLLFRGTAKELRLLCDNDQLELLPKGAVDAPPENI